MPTPESGVLLGVFAHSVCLITEFYGRSRPKDPISLTEVDVVLTTYGMVTYEFCRINKREKASTSFGASTSKKEGQSEPLLLRQMYFMTQCAPLFSIKIQKLQNNGVAKRLPCPLCGLCNGGALCSMKRTSSNRTSQKYLKQLVLFRLSFAGA